jgi:hypothetical protein
MDDMKFAFYNIEESGVFIDGMLGYELFIPRASIVKFTRRELLLG